SQLSASPLLSGASGRLWIAKDGRVRMELQAEKGDTQVLYDGNTLTVYDASSNTLYRYKVPASEGGKPTDHETHEVPSVAHIEEVTVSDNHQTEDSGGSSATDGSQPQVTTHGHGITGVAVVERKTTPGEKPLNLPEGLPKVHIGSTTATELPTALGTLLSF